MTFFIKSHYNFDHSSVEGEYNDSPSMTEPDQSYSIRELFVKFAGGQLPNISQSTYYEEEYDPTSEPSFDILDAYAIENDLRSNDDFTSFLSRDFSTDPVKDPVSSTAEESSDSDSAD